MPHVESLTLSVKIDVGIEAQVFVSHLLRPEGNLTCVVGVVLYGMNDIANP